MLFFFRPLPIALCALTLALPAAAQVYRCTQPDGRTTVQDTPCNRPTGGSGAPATGGLDLLPERQCVYWARAVSPASDLTQCLMSFSGSRDSYAIDFVQVSVGGKPVTLQLFDVSQQDRELSPGTSVVDAERLSFASPDKSLQVFLRAALVPPRKPVRESYDSDYAYGSTRLKYQGKLIVKTGAGEKTIDIAYERPASAARSQGGGRALKSGR
jgi:hypothetical protein